MPADERDLRQVGLLMRAPFRSSRRRWLRHWPRPGGSQLLSVENIA